MRKQIGNIYGNNMEFMGKKYGNKWGKKRYMEILRKKHGNKQGKMEEAMRGKKGHKYGKKGKDSKKIGKHIGK